MVVIKGDVTSEAGVTFKFDAVPGRHVTLAITRPHISPAGARLQMNVYDPSGAQDAGAAVFSTSPTEIDFTPTSQQAGPTKVVVSAPIGTGATGAFTLTYARDVTAKLVSGVSVHSALAYEGQHADYTFLAVTGQHITLALDNPRTEGARLQMNVYDPSGAQDAGAAVFSTSPTEIDFTPTSQQAGLTTVVISPYDTGATGASSSPTPGTWSAACNRA